MDEIAWGLELAEHPFIWMVKSQIWSLLNERVEQERKGWDKTDFLKIFEGQLGGDMWYMIFTLYNCPCHA